MQTQDDCKNVVQRPNHSLMIQVVRLVLCRLGEIPTGIRGLLNGMVRVLWIEKEWVARKAIEQ